MSHDEVADGVESKRKRRDCEREYANLTAFRRDILRVVAAADADAPYGLAIKRALESWYDEVQNHGRLYPNLDELVDAGLLDKSAKDKRTNGYALTSRGMAVLAAGSDAQARAFGLENHHAIPTILGSDMYE